MILDIDSSESPVHSAEGWDEVLLPIIDRYRRRRQRVVVRADAAFAMPALYYFTLQLAESYLTGALFQQILQRIEWLGWHPT